MVQLFVRFWLYPGNRIHIVSVKFWLCVEKNPTSTLEKVTLNNLIFLILYKYTIFCHLFFFKNWQFLALCSSQIKRLIIPKCAKKWLCSRQSYVLKVWKNPFSLSKWSNYPSSFHNMSQNNIQEILSQKLMYLQFWQSFQVSVKFWPCSRKILCPWSI